MTGHISEFVHFHISVSQILTFNLVSSFIFKAKFILCHILTKDKSIKTFRIDASKQSFYG
mgnify:CR=1 FL=1